VCVCVRECAYKMICACIHSLKALKTQNKNCVRTRLCVCAHVCVHARVYAREYHAPTGTQQKTHAHMCVCVCTCLCVYVLLCVCARAPGAAGDSKRVISHLEFSHLKLGFASAQNIAKLSQQSKSSAQAAHHHKGHPSLRYNPGRIDLNTLSADLQVTAPYTRILPL
jgi:hypothetical protein